MHRASREARFFFELARGRFGEGFTGFDAAARCDPDRWLRVQRVDDAKQQHAAGLVYKEHPTGRSTSALRHGSRGSLFADVGAVHGALELALEDAKSRSFDHWLKQPAVGAELRPDVRGQLFGGVSLGRVERCS